MPPMMAYPGLFYYPMTYFFGKKSFLDLFEKKGDSRHEEWPQGLMMVHASRMDLDVPHPVMYTTNHTAVKGVTKGHVEIRKE